MDKLAKLFGDGAVVKIMRLFLFNQEAGFEFNDVVGRSKVTKTVARRELKTLEDIGFIKKRSFFKDVKYKSRKKGVKYEFKKKRVNGWFLNKNFELLNPLHDLLLDSELIREKDIVKQIRSAGNIKLLILSGLFAKDPDRELDILIVGDKLNKAAAERALATLEAEIGRELRYAIFTQEEFEYRTDMYDKLIRDVFDYRNIKLIDKIQVNFD